MPRDKFIIKSSKKLKALHHIHKYCRHIKDQQERDELQSKVMFEIKLAIFLLDQYLGIDNIDKWKAPKNS